MARAKQNLKRNYNYFQSQQRKLVLSPGRNAYLGLIALNVHKLATNLARVDQKQLKAKWEKLGGNFEKLQMPSTKAKQKNPILGIGVVEATTLLAAAAPVIIAMAVLIKSLKKTKPGDDADFAKHVRC